MAAEQIRLIEPCEQLADALIEYVEEFRRVGETFWQNEARRVREDVEGYLRERRDWSAGRNLPEGFVPETHYWLVRGGRILGVIRIRHRLTDKLRTRGGHIGYDIRPSERRKGYGTRMLAMALVEARRIGLDRVMVTCDRGNVASARVILANGGVFESEGPDPETGEMVHRYWIELWG